MRSALLTAFAGLGMAAACVAQTPTAASNGDDLRRFHVDVCGHGEAESEVAQLPQKRNHIFVSIASYRDPLCKRTIADLFAKADHPGRITVGVVQQNQAGSVEDCIAGCALCAEKQRLGQIKVKDYDYTQARGPAFARWAASKLWDGSEFYLQIDAHSNFQPHWDRSIVAQYRALGDPQAILTHHPPAPFQIDYFLDHGVTSLNCAATMSDDGIFRQRSRGVNARLGPLPLRSPFAAAGFLFMPARVLFEVPFDPYLVFLFRPEESLLSARLWTAGFNLYAPTRPIISHEYHQQASPRYYQRADAFAGCRFRATTRAQYILGRLPRTGVDPAFRAGLDRYGVGRARSLADFYINAGLDPTVAGLPIGAANGPPGPPALLTASRCPPRAGH